MRHPLRAEQTSGSRAARVGVALTLVVITGLGAFALLTQHAVVSEAGRADSATQLAAAYQDARFWVGQEESLERKYRLEPSPAVLTLHNQAELNVSVLLNRVLTLDGSPSTRRAITSRLHENAEYVRATRLMFAAVAAKQAFRVRFFDQWVTEPIFNALQTTVYDGAAAAARRALRESASLRRDESAGFHAGVIALVLALALVATLGLAIHHHQRAGRASREAELERLGEMAITDPLTGLPNHRAFHEDLARELQRVGRTGVPLALVMIDVDDLKIVNDTYGHLAGDDQLQALAETLAMTQRATDRAYRIGGDEFAVILSASRDWAAFQFAQRLHETLERREGRQLSATTGISEAVEARPKDDVIHEADLALINAKRSHQDVALYSPDMVPLEQSTLQNNDEHYTRTLASALAVAVDAKDSYTRSHCQTVATLCTLIASELGFDAQRVGQIRLAGLLHDVGKIGIPDAILQKPSKLTAAEFETMKTHSVLGEGIVLAAEMPLEASWVRHHHERIDGGGYPDGLSGEEIPLESRIIHVADAFEAMTSDRPYRDAPGGEFAIQELRRHAGTQFDAAVVAALLRAIGDGSAEDLLEAESQVVV